MNIRKKAKKNFFTSFFAFQLTESCSGTHVMLFLRNQRFPLEVKQNARNTYMAFLQTKMLNILP